LLDYVYKFKHVTSKIRNPSLVPWKHKGYWIYHYPLTILLHDAHKVNFDSRLRIYSTTASTHDVCDLFHSVYGTSPLSTNKGFLWWRNGEILKIYVRPSVPIVFQRAKERKKKVFKHHTFTQYEIKFSTKIILYHNAAQLIGNTKQHSVVGSGDKMFVDLENLEMLTNCSSYFSYSGIQGWYWNPRGMSSVQDFNLPSRITPEIRSISRN